MKIVQGRQKSYSDTNRKELDFEENNWVFLKILPITGIVRFEKRGKLNPWYMGPLKILEKIEPVAY